MRFPEPVIALESAVNIEQNRQEAQASAERLTGRYGQEAGAGSVRRDEGPPRSEPLDVLA